ncbi:asparagine synthase (glutamine-hydrolyzing) [Methylobacterium oxalidis]|uniref:asparagine synthase (glutamine-hydrolyzing) n=1 Tax=Methylobacterium oxalidis TaxID=944322 RepID=A0A512IYL8_9HYPH|nr:asparagine synthase (glutamine-hydrolyzing) [Methylobacterium oxalidis]GEP02699.1 asparagine synthetase B [Methylobacterium oxalidis]GJE33595.1 Asparagine synthetase [glutamine-hydrolyzing] 1 [Methylobacterium oxalidis]GLS66903.1 asparagine synthetase B [Methylobacterium oxalidis]
MCGIAGYIDPNAPLGLLDRQLGCIMHRGPDGEGRYEAGALHLGMRRLSIIDLAGGWQPLYSREGQVVAFQNGEIYNFKALRNALEARGYSFVSHSDTEVLAHGYDAWGIEGLLDRVDGMFALAIADLDRRVLHLARDRFGEKPLYFAFKPGHFVYGSSLKSVAITPWIRGEVNAWAVHRYLASHFVSGRQTLLSDVSKVLPGERLEINFDAAHEPRLYRYYRPQLEPSREASVDEIRSLLEEAVESRLVSDVPVGLFLSGGIDSSLIAALAARRHSDVEAFCIGFDDPTADESSHAESVARHLGIKLNTFHFDSRRFSELLPVVCAALDEPIGDQALLPVHWLAHAAASKVKVVLSGEGADEIFGGYSYYASRARQLIGDFSAAYSAAHDVRSMAPGLLVESAGETQSGFPLLTYLHERESAVPHAGSEPDKFERDLVEWLTSAHDPVQRMGAADLASWLPDDLLIKADRMTMAASIEGRAPFLSRKIVERALSLPPHQKYLGQESKVLLRELARSLLPRDIIDRKKHGFVLPMADWVQDWFRLNGGFSAYVRQGIGLGLDPVALTEIHRAPGNHSRERLWFALIALIEWWTSFNRDVTAARSPLSSKLA